MLLVPLNMFKPSSVFADCAKAVFLWIIFVVCVSCLSLLCGRLFLVALWSLAGKRLTSWQSCVMCYNCILCFVTFTYGVPGKAWT